MAGRSVQAAAGPASQGSAAATSRLHPETRRGAAAVIIPLTAVDGFVVVVVVVGFVAMLGIFHWRSSIQSRQKWPYRGVARMRFAILAAVTFLLYQVGALSKALSFLSHLKRS